MKFLCLGYHDKSTFDILTEDEKLEILGPCPAMCEQMHATGKVVDEHALGSHTRAKSIRTRNGKQTVTDGPLVETKEQLGAYFIVEADCIEEAVVIASMHPGAQLGEEYGWGIEVRPIGQEEAMRRAFEQAKAK